MEMDFLSIAFSVPIIFSSSDVQVGYSSKSISHPVSFGPSSIHADPDFGSPMGKINSTWHECQVDGHLSYHYISAHSLSFLGDG